MNSKIYPILLAIGAEVIVGVICFLLIPESLMQPKVAALDFAVLTIINIIFTWNVLFPFIDRTDRSHKEAAGLGLRWATTGWYAVLAVAFMICNLIYSWEYSEPGLSFGWQATIQGALLLFFLGGILASRESMAKAKEVYESEQGKKEGKRDVKAALSALQRAAEDTPAAETDVKERISHLMSESRYITPSKAAEAREADSKIMNLCVMIEVAFSDYGMNKETIERQLSQLERDLQRRRQL